jgi:penicillin-binding protein 2
MRSRIWKKWWCLVLVGLSACSAPSGPAEIPAEDYLQCREVYRPRRGRIYDRNDSLLVSNVVRYTMLLPRLPAFDSVAFNELLGWPAGAVQARVAAARLPAGPPPPLKLDTAGVPIPRTEPVAPRPRWQRWPVVLALTAPEAAALRQHATAWPGLSVQQQRGRGYGVSVAAPVLGYTAAATAVFMQQAMALRKGGYIQRLRNGGVESYYNALLAGRRGTYHPLTDGHGRVHGSWATDTIYHPGQDLHLSLDIKLQAYAERLLGERRGYIVALEPATGEILCYVSAPTYDPAVLTTPGRSSERRALLLSEDKPLLNRPALLANPPGSVFKLVNAAVALQLGAIPADTSFQCDQSLINCVHPHPRARNLTQALKYSCNPYFYQVLRAVINRKPGADTCATRAAHLADWARLVRSFGLDTLLHLDVTREQPGFIPTPKYYNKLYGACGWKYPTISSLSIGQGEINLTGLQTANVLACIANRGWYITPHFVRAVGRSGQPLARFLDKHHTLVDSINFAALIPGMEAAMQRGGTAELASLADVGIAVAGKTGTVQNDEGDDHATFAGFAPARNPKIVVAVYIENAGFGGLSAAPCASLIMEKYLRGRIAPKRKRWEWWLRCGDLASQGD